MAAVGETSPVPPAEAYSPANSPTFFARISHRYDALNRLMSLGWDLRWREVAADALRLPPGGRVLDVGVGTGDMALALLDRWPGRAIAGVDPTLEMMRAGRHKPRTQGMGWAQGDGLRLPFPDAYFDGAVSAFVLRNVPDVSLALAEQRRVVRPGGRVVCLEMTWPRTPGLRQLFHLYFADLMPRITGLLSGQPGAYRYLPRSVQRFPTPEALKTRMEGVGLRSVHYRMMGLGTVALHVGER